MAGQTLTLIRVHFSMFALECYSWLNITRITQLYPRQTKGRQEYDWLCRQLLLVPMEMTWLLSLSGINQQVSRRSQVAFLFVFNSSSLLPTPGADIQQLQSNFNTITWGSLQPFCKPLLDGWCWHNSAVIFTVLAGSQSQSQSLLCSGRASWGGQWGVRCTSGQSLHCRGEVRSTVTYLSVSVLMPDVGSIHFF